jgi:hypothetical protein
MTTHNENEDYNTWSSERDRIRFFWVLAAVAFWVTVIVQVLVYLLKDELNLILISIAGGMMVLGLWFKIRFQLHMRKQPPNDESSDRVRAER